jgi:hypothetical protein
MQPLKRNGRLSRLWRMPAAERLLLSDFVAEIGVQTARDG